MVGRQRIQLHLLGLQWDSGKSDDSDDISTDTTLIAVMTEIIVITMRT